MRNHVLFYLMSAHLGRNRRYTQNAAFVPRRFSRRQVLRKLFVFLRLAAFTQRYALPARRFTHALRVVLANLCTNYGSPYFELYRLLWRRAPLVPRGM